MFWQKEKCSWRVQRTSPVALASTGIEGKKSPNRLNPLGRFSFLLRPRSTHSHFLYLLSTSLPSSRLSTRSSASSRLPPSIATFDLRVQVDTILGEQRLKHHLVPRNTKISTFRNSYAISTQHPKLLIKVLCDREEADRIPSAQINIIRLLTL